MKSIKKQFIALAILLLLVVSPVTSVSAQKRISRTILSETSEIKTGALTSEPRLSTPKTVYAAGEKVVIDGSNFGSFEPVAINVERVGFYGQSNDLLAGWTISADENGNIRGEWVMPFEGAFVIKATGAKSGVETQTSIASVAPILIQGNPSCGTLNASSDPAFAHIITNFGFKLQTPPTGTYTFTEGDGRELTGGAPAEPGSTLTITRLGPTAFNWAATRSISAVIVKAGDNANVYPYNPSSFGDQNLITSGTNEISHLEFCYGPPAASITIIKDAQPNSTQAFEFNASGQVVQDFSLVDNGVVGPDRIQFTNLTGFGAANTVTITEGASSPYSLTQINCTSNGTQNNTINIPLRFATIQLEPGENVVCTFVNSIVTAAGVSAGGQVTDAFGNPISRARVTIQNTSTGETRIALTNGFGYYRFEDLPAGDLYIAAVSHRRYAFAQDSQLLVLNEAIENANFTALPE